MKGFERSSAMFLATMDFGKSYCLSFWYRNHISGTLNVKIQNHQVQRVPHSTTWSQVRVTLTPPKRYDTEARVMASMPANAYGDVDIDDVEITHGAC